MRSAIAPVLIAVVGFAWMAAATEHFQKETGRGFYALAGHQNDDTLDYLPGGEHIVRWTLEIPPAATGAAMLLSLLISLAVFRREPWWSIVAIVGSHILAAAGFFLLVGWYAINITGVFI